MIATFRRLAAVCCIAGMSIAGTARADGEGGDAPGRGTGKIVELTPTRVTIQLKGGERMLELTLTDKTQVVTRSGETVRVVTGRGDVQELAKAIDCKIADLKVNHWVNVTYADGIALHVFSSMIGQDIGEGGERGGEGDRPREGARDGDRPREGARDGDRPREGARDGDRVRVGEEGDRPREIRRDGDAPREGERLRDGDRPREGDRPRDVDRPRDGEAPAEIRRDGEGTSATAASLLVGDIGSVEAGKLTVNLTRRNRQTGGVSTVKIEPTTQVRIEGNDAKAEDLRPGMPVSVTVEKGVAVRIEVPIDLSKPRGE